MIQFLDKLSLNYASAYSLKDDLGLGGLVSIIISMPYLMYTDPHIGNGMDGQQPVRFLFASQWFYTNTNSI